MTPEQQRIAIAEACGWKRKPEFDYTRLMPGTVNAMERIEMWGTDNGHLIPFDKIPDYLNDLNAMHEAEKVLTDEQRHTYGETLAQMVRMPENATFGEALEDKFPFNGWGFFEVATMTSQERAEAFLRTLGKWEDSK